MGGASIRRTVAAARGLRAGNVLPWWVHRVCRREPSFMPPTAGPRWWRAADGDAVRPVSLPAAALCRRLTLSPLWQWCSGESMKLPLLSVLLLAGLAAVARAEPSAEASLAIKADLAKARAALARHDTPAVVEALDDAMRHLSNADEESLQALTAFEDQFRDALAKATAEPAVSSPPAS